MPRTATTAAAITLAAVALVAPDAAAQRQPTSGRIYRSAPPFDDWTIEGFRALDRNRDGRITTAEWAYDRADFQRADHDGDGVLSQREFLGEADDTPFDDVDAGDDEGAADARFTDLDANRDHRVSRSEWRGDRAAFERLDENRDGVLTRAEMAVDDDGADDFAALDTDRNGVVTRGEWPQSAAAFQRLDADRDGRLTPIEYAAGRGAATSTPAPPAANSAAYRGGYERGLAEGRAAGREDRARNQGWDLEGQRELERADSGYRREAGSLADWQAGYRTAFRIGYREGFGPR